MCNLFTIGYATKNLDEFIRLLKKNDVAFLVDVRTSPYSGQFPDYNRENLELELKRNGITYLFFGAEFGARRAEKEAYTREKIFNGEEIEYVDFIKVQSLDIFKRGCGRIINGINKGYKICFMCSEKLPQDCHRCVMVGDWFYQNGYEVKHIISGTESVMHDEMLHSAALKKRFDDDQGEYNKKTQTPECDLLGNPIIVDNSFIPQWKKFFEVRDDRKIIRLLNIKIGYKEGDDNND